MGRKPIKITPRDMEWVQGLADGKTFKELQPDMPEGGIKTRVRRTAHSTLTM